MFKCSLPNGIDCSNKVSLEDEQLKLCQPIASAEQYQHEPLMSFQNQKNVSWLAWSLAHPSAILIPICQTQPILFQSCFCHETFPSSSYRCDLHLFSVQIPFESSTREVLRLKTTKQFEKLFYFHQNIKTYIYRR